MAKPETRASTVSPKGQNKCSTFMSDGENKMKRINRLKIDGRLIITAAFLFALGAMTACQTKTESKIIPANQPSVPLANKAEKKADVTEETNKQTKMDIDKSNDNSLASPTDAYKTAFALRKGKDANGLKKVLSKKMLDFLVEMGKSESKSLDDQLKELVEQPQAATAESRGERIVGDMAALEYLDQDGKWKLMGFVKEDGDWKMTMPDSKISAIWDAPR